MSLLVKHQFKKHFVGDFHRQTWEGDQLATSPTCIRTYAGRPRSAHHLRLSPTTEQTYLCIDRLQSCNQELYSEISQLQPLTVITGRFDGGRPIIVLSSYVSLLLEFCPLSSQHPSRTMPAIELRWVKDGPCPGPTCILYLLQVVNKSRQVLIVAD